MTQTQARGRVRIEDCAKRVRGYLGGELVVESIRPKLVWEIPYYPAYYFPAEDVLAALVPTGRVEHSPSRGDAHWFSVSAGGRTSENAGFQYPDSPLEELRGLVRFDWQALDHWFEEDEEVIVHPRSPYSRIDVLPSSRHVRVEINGVTVAESSKPSLLFETGLPTRYYLPLTHVRMELLRPSELTTSCPYKGHASYWSVEADGELAKDVVWTYPAPLPESQRIAGMACFYNERVDLYVDGVRQDRPHTPFSPR